MLRCYVISRFFLGRTSCFHGSRSLLAIIACLIAFANATAQYGCVGFANVTADGLQGTTGGGQGKIVHARNRAQLEEYCASAEPLSIIIDRNLKGNRKLKHDIISVQSNKTIIGGGKGVTLDYIGFDFKNVENIIVRNLRIINASPDALAFRNCHHVWVDHCDLSACDDGLLDFTLGSSYLTVSYTKFSNHNKTSICCSGTGHAEDHNRQRVTYHHNWFDHTTQRNPRIGYGRLHVFNTYYSDISLYCIGYFCRAKAVSEHNYFLRSSDPYKQMYSDNPTSAYYGEIKAWGDNLVNCTGNTEPTGTDFDPAAIYDYQFALEDGNEVPSAAMNNCGTANGIQYGIIALPGNGKKDVFDLKTLQWNPVEGAKSYTIYFGTQDAVIAQEETTATSFPLPELSPATTYYWKVAAHTRKGDYSSPMYRFTMADTVTGNTSSTQSSSLATLDPTPLNCGRTEAEHMTRCERTFIERQDGTYFTASNDTVTTGEAGKGTLSGIWHGDSINADITVAYFDEQDGEGQYEICVNGDVKAKWKACINNESMQAFTARNIPLAPGDRIEITFTTDRGMLCRTDYVEIKESRF